MPVQFPLLSSSMPASLDKDVDIAATLFQLLCMVLKELEAYHSTVHILAQVDQAYFKIAEEMHGHQLKA